MDKANNDLFNIDDELFNIDELELTDNVSVDDDNTLADVLDDLSDSLEQAFIQKRGELEESNSFKGKSLTLEVETEEDKKREYELRLKNLKEIFNANLELINNNIYQFYRKCKYNEDIKRRDLLNENISNISHKISDNIISKLNSGLLDSSVPFQELMKNEFRANIQEVMTKNLQETKDKYDKLYNDAKVNYTLDTVGLIYDIEFDGKCTFTCEHCGKVHTVEPKQLLSLKIGKLVEEGVRITDSFAYRRVNYGGYECECGKTLIIPPNIVVDIVNSMLSEKQLTKVKGMADATNSIMYFNGGAKFKDISRIYTKVELAIKEAEKKVTNEKTLTVTDYVKGIKPKAPVITKVRDNTKAIEDNKKKEEERMNLEQERMDYARNMIGKNTNDLSLALKIILKCKNLKYYIPDELYYDYKIAKINGEDVKLMDIITDYEIKEANRDKYKRECFKNPLYMELNNLGLQPELIQSTYNKIELLCSDCDSYPKEFINLLKLMYIPYISFDENLELVCTISKEVRERLKEPIGDNLKNLVIQNRQGQPYGDITAIVKSSLVLHQLYFKKHLLNIANEQFKKYIPAIQADLKANYEQLNYLIGSYRANIDAYISRNNIGVYMDTNQFIIMASDPDFYQPLTIANGNSSYCINNQNYLFDSTNYKIVTFYNKTFDFIYSSTGYNMKFIQPYDTLDLDKLSYEELTAPKTRYSMEYLRLQYNIKDNGKYETPEEILFEKLDREKISNLPIALKKRIYEIGEFDNGFEEYYK